MLAGLFKMLLMLLLVELCTLCLFQINVNENDSLCRCFMDLVADSEFNFVFVVVFVVA